MSIKTPGVHLYCERCGQHMNFKYEVVINVDLTHSVYLCCNNCETITDLEEITKDSKKN
jgi:uncharacterized Zn finger protein